MKTLKRIILSVAVIIAATGFSFSQSYSITPNDTFEISGYMEDLQTLTISELNTTNDSIYLKWQKVSESVPSNWEASICDNRVCYTVLMDSGAMNPVLPTETGFLLLHITGHVNYGTAIIRYAVWDIANSSVKDTVTFIMTISQPSAITETEDNAFQMFPNPVNDLLNFAFGDNRNFPLSVYNSLGEKTFSTASTTGLQVSTANWPNGVYYVSIFDKDRISNTKKIIVQH